jgi:hypothetical protein
VGWSVGFGVRPACAARYRRDCGLCHMALACHMAHHSVTFCHAI